MRDGKGYKLPDPVDPGAYKCVKVFIPADPLYFAAFWQAYAFFGKWLAWERTDDTRATEAAAIWRTGWNMARRLWPDMEGECDMPYELRDNPDDPCSVQQSLDGGATWFHAFFKDCDDIDGVETPTNEAAEKAGNFIFNMYYKIVEMLYEEPTREDFIEDYCNYMTASGVTIDFEPYNTCEGAGGNLWDTWQSDMTGPEKEEYIDPCFWANKFEEMQSCFDADGLMDWLGCANDAIMGWLEETSNAMMHDLNHVASLISGESAQNAADYDGGGGGGAGFGETCIGTFECVDFDETPGGFVRVGGFGQWIDGLGWKAQINGSKWECRIRKSGGFPAGTPGNVKVVYNPTGNAKVAQLYLNGVMVKEQLGGSAGYRELNYTPTGPITSVEIYVSQNTLNSTLTIDELCITE